MLDNTQHERMIHKTLATLTLALACGLLSCKSFDDSIKPVIALDHGESTADTGQAKKIYMKGIKSISDADPTRLHVEPWRIITDYYPDSIRLFVRVYDDDGYLITNLAPPRYNGTDDYRKIWSGLTEQIGVDGVPKSINDFTVREFSELDGLPNEISLVLDYSGTMGTNIEMLEDAAVNFIKLKKPQDRVAVVKFDSKPHLVVRATNSAPDLLAAFGEGLKGYGEYTALYSATKLGGEQIANAPTTNPRALILFTDGEDNASEIDNLDVFDYNKAHNIPIFAVAFGAVNRDALEDLATYTGGKYYQADSPQELRAVFEDIYRSLQNYYLVSYRPLSDDGRHLVHVSLNPPGTDRPIAGTIEYNTFLGIQRTGPGEVVEPPPVENIFFAYNSAELLPASNAALDELASFMRDKSRREIQVQGHTSAEGTDEYNQVLSEQRAEAIRNALVERGIESRRITTKGFGKSRPIAPNDTEEGREKNRRVTIVLTRR